MDEVKNLEFVSPQTRPDAVVALWGYLLWGRRRRLRVSNFPFAADSKPAKRDSGEPIGGVKWRRGFAALVSP
jgi:hypothetical protein